MMLIRKAKINNKSSNFIHSIDDHLVWFGCLTTLANIKLVSRLECRRYKERWDAHCLTRLDEDPAIDPSKQAQTLPLFTDSWERSTYVVHIEYTHTSAHSAAHGLWSELNLRSFKSWRVFKKKSTSKQCVWNHKNQTLVRFCLSDSNRFTWTHFIDIFYPSYCIAAVTSITTDCLQAALPVWQLADRLSGHCRQILVSTPRTLGKNSGGDASNSAPPLLMSRLTEFEAKTQVQL